VWDAPGTPVVITSTTMTFRLSMGGLALSIPAVVGRLLAAFGQRHGATLLAGPALGILVLAPALLFLGVMLGPPLSRHPPEVIHIYHLAMPDVVRPGLGQALLALGAPGRGWQPPH
jgi:hypothetical protein